MIRATDGKRRSTPSCVHGSLGDRGVARASAEYRASRLHFSKSSPAATPNSRRYSRRMGSFQTSAICLVPVTDSMRRYRNIASLSNGMDGTGTEIGYSRIGRKTGRQGRLAIVCCEYDWACLVSVTWTSWLNESPICLPPSIVWPDTSVDSLRIPTSDSLSGERMKCRGRQAWRCSMLSDECGSPDGP